MTPGESRKMPGERTSGLQRRLPLLHCNQNLSQGQQRFCFLRIRQPGLPKILGGFRQTPGFAMGFCSPERLFRSRGNILHWPRVLRLCRIRTNSGGAQRFVAHLTSFLEGFQGFCLKSGLQVGIAERHPLARGGGPGLDGLFHPG